VESPQKREDLADCPGIRRRARLFTAWLQRAITTADSGEIALTFARGAIVLPEPLASIALALRDQRISSEDVDGWLLPGRNPARDAHHRRAPAQGAWRPTA
jgi:hypothetical protein